MRSLRVALIGGPAYDPLYAGLAGFSASHGVAVEVGFQGDHPSLNRHLAQAGELPYDLVSTHSKYAPSQQQLLAPLDSLLAWADLSDFLPTARELPVVAGQRFGLPRNLDVRVLHYRQDLVPRPPTTWDDLLDTARRLKHDGHGYGFVFPGKESGLFGTFYELCEMGGATLFPESLIPDVLNDGGRWALRLLHTFYTEGLVPPEIVDWHFDEVHRCFRDGEAAMAGEWPAYYSLLQDPDASAVAGRFSLARYPIGPGGRSRSYGGGHTFALTPHGAQRPEVLALLNFLTSPAQQLGEAQRGMVPVRRSVMGTIEAESLHREQHRWQLLDSVIANDILIPPKFAAYPAVEHILWRTVQAAMTGELAIDAALEQIVQQVCQVVLAAAPTGR